MMEKENASDASTSSYDKPTILFICGAWHVPEHYAPLTTLLQSYGYDVHCPLLPSDSNRSSPANLDDDILFIRPYAQSLLSKGTNLAIIGHSYGGIVSSYAFANMSATNNGESGRIIHLIYLTAFIPLPSESLMAIFGSCPPFLTPNPSNGNIDISPATVHKHFYQNCHPWQRSHAISMMTNHSVASQFDAPGLPHSANGAKVLEALGISSSSSTTTTATTRKVSTPPFATINPNPALTDLKMPYDDPTTATTYIYCTEDAGIPLAVQQMMVGRIRDQRGVKVREEAIQADHSPFVGRVEEAAAVVVRVLGG